MTFLINNDYDEGMTKMFCPTCIMSVQVSMLSPVYAEMLSLLTEMHAACRDEPAPHWTALDVILINEQRAKAKSLIG